MVTDEERQLVMSQDEIQLENVREKNASKIFWMHFRALTRKRFLYFKRDVRGLLCEVFIPIIVVWLGFFITTI